MKQYNFSQIRSFSDNQFGIHVPMTGEYKIIWQFGGVQRFDPVWLWKGDSFIPKNHCNFPCSFIYFQIVMPNGILLDDGQGNTYFSIRT